MGFSRGCPVRKGQNHAIKGLAFQAMQTDLRGPAFESDRVGSAWIAVFLNAWMGIIGDESQIHCFCFEQMSKPSRHPEAYCASPLNRSGSFTGLFARLLLSQPSR